MDAPNATGHDRNRSNVIELRRSRSARRGPAGRSQERAALTLAADGLGQNLLALPAESRWRSPMEMWHGIIVRALA